MLSKQAVICVLGQQIHSLFAASIALFACVNVSTTLALDSPSAITLTTNTALICFDLFRVVALPLLKANLLKFEFFQNRQIVVTSARSSIFNV